MEPYEPRLREVRKLARGHRVKKSLTPNTLFYNPQAMFLIEKVGKWSTLWDFRERNKE